MTNYELRALDFIRDRLTATGVAPTREEIAAKLGFAAKSTAARLVDSLERQGLIIREAHRARNIRLPGAPVLTIVPTEELRAELARRGDL